MKARKIVALVIIIYNLLGLIALFGMDSDDPFYMGDNSILSLCTFPIYLISFGIRFTTIDTIGSILLIFFIQAIILTFTVFIGDLVTRLILRIFKKN